MNKAHQITVGEYNDMLLEKIDSMDIKHNYRLCHMPVDGDRIEDEAYLAKVTLDIFNDRDRPTDPQSVQERVLLLRAWENKLKTTFHNANGFQVWLSAVAGGESHLPEDAIKMRKLRRKKHMSQSETAEYLGISRGMVSHIETGRKPAPPSVKRMLK